MLAALAAQRLPEHAAATARQRFADALAAASRNQTELGESGAIAELREVSAGALAGDPRALEHALAAIASLERANRLAMQKASVDARRLGTAGAWALTLLGLLGLLGFAAGSLVRQRLQRRVAAPLLELERVLLSFEAGDQLQRCTNAGSSVAQQHALRALNRLLDMVESPSPKPSAVAGPAELAPWLLDAEGDALAVLDARGGIVSASRAALQLLSDERGEQLLERLQRAAQGSTEERVKMIRRSERFALLAIVQPVAELLESSQQS